MKQLPLGFPLRERATFATFHAGQNVEVVAHLRNAPAQMAARATWLYGAAGTGKTHLLQAVCAAADPALPAAYLPCAEILVAGPGALDGLSEFALLCLDDVDRLAGDNGFERGLFSIYRAVEERGARVVAAARQPPGALPWALPDLASRIAASAVFMLHALEEPAQIEVLGARAAARGFELPEDTARYLLRRLPRDMGTQCRILDELDRAALSAQRRITVPFIRAVLDGL